MSFIKTNIYILLAFFINLAGAFSYVTVLPAILISNYGFEIATLSIGTSVFFTFFAISSAYYTNHLDNTTNPIPTIMLLSAIEILITIALIISLYMDVDKSVVVSIFLISRAIDGWCGAGHMTIFRYIIKSKLYTTTTNPEKMNSIIDSTYSFLKFAMPISGAFAADYISTLSPIIMAITLMLLSMAIIFSYRKELTHSLSSVFSRKPGDKNPSIISGAMTFISKDKYRPVRFHYLAIVFFRDTTQPFFNFFIPLYLISTHSYQVSEAAMISSWVLIGMTLQFTSSRYLKTIPTGLYQSASNIFLATSILIMFIAPQVMEDKLMLSLVMFMTGYSIGMKDNWKNKLQNRIKRDGIDFSHTILFSSTVGVVAMNTILFVIATLSISNPKNVFSFMTIIAITLITLSVMEIVMDHRYKNAKKYFQ